ncbi:DUF1223 domain-containing protein [Caulobacter sp. SLTY]|uniref:DUF1223 domain-containing protein n=1 Tax=Caulobacter sp. SLTY TaxID=2683262 RepID=UPI001412F254|nr:DUF1223 domain-containing protein [Caulobacter sp. SLTY]NBB14109.1 DUF1223 domain-containing protein [Caulobacter sp. SLTY]
MRRILLFLALAALVPGMAPIAASAAQPSRPPVVVELFTAQGCSSCRAANDHLAEIADDPGVLALTFAVDYWDYLGWRDTFAQPAFVERQRAYARKLAIREVYTPQVVVDGRYQTGGGRADKVDALVTQAAKAPRNPPDMQFLGTTRVAVGSGPVPRGGAEVWLIRYDPRAQEVTPRKGDNRGETLVHKNVVRQVARLGGWAGRPTAYRTPKATEDGLKTVVILQAAKGGRILAVLTEPAS